uniref:DUF7597 domain-containing protein n=1 Tax=Hordeum vulgare subsp. vulgare TaxID=112509 RepID=A0A8I6Z1F3_HORVV
MPPATPPPPPAMANFELDPEFFLPPGHNIIDGGPDLLPRTYTMHAVPITRRHERFVIAEVHPAPPADNVVQGVGFRGQEGFRHGCHMILGVPLDFRNTEDLWAAVNTFGEFHHWVSDDPYLVRSIVFASFTDDRLVPRNPVVPAADVGGWGQPPVAADGGGWEPKAAPEAPVVNPIQDQESMVIDQPSPSSSDSVHELVDLAPQPQGDMKAEPADQAHPAHDLEVIVANPVAPDADMPPAAQGHDAEPEEDVPVMEEAQDDNPLAIVLYKPPHFQTDNIFVGAARMPILEPIMIPKQSWAAAFDHDAPEPPSSEPASSSLSMQEVIPLSPSSSAEDDLSFHSPAPSKKGTRKKATPAVDSSVRRCTRGSIKRDGFKPILQELPAHVPKKRKPKAKPMPSTSQETEDVQVPPPTPITVIQEVGQSLGIAREKLTVDRLMEDPADSAPSSVDV